MMTDEIVGIDLGTTNSEIAVYRDGRPEILADEQGRMILPSVVGLTEAGELLVGEEARNQLLLYPDRTIRSIKRRMGQDETVRLAEPRLHAAGDLGDHPQAAEGDRRAPAGPAGAQGGDHRAGLLLRRPAPGDARGRRDRRAGGGAHHQRADRRGAGLRGRAASGQADPGLRPGRRHLRRLGRAHRGRRRRGHLQPRQQPSRRRRFRPEDRRARTRAPQDQAGRRCLRRAAGDGAHPAGGRGGEAASFRSSLRPHRGRVPGRDGRASRSTCRSNWRATSTSR